MKHILQVAIAAILTFGFLLSGTSIEESVLTVDRLDYYVSTKKTYVLKPYFKEIKCDAGKDKDSEINTTVPSEPNDTYLENEQMLTVYNSQEKKIAIISVREYLVGTLSVEMPAYFNIEALKAQAVAARTYLYNKMKNGGCKKYGTYDICSSCGHCQGYQSVQKRKELWGASFEKYEQKMLDAVMTTEGECVSYNDDIINAMYHSSSAGRTEDYSQRYASVFLPYLVSVSTPENIDQITTEKYYKYDELVNIITKKYPDCGINAENIKNCLKIIEHTESGRASRVKIGNKTISGAAFAGLLSQRSTDISIVFMQEKILVLCRGYGHGIGMSQIGANLMASNGKKYREILAHYYKGTDTLKVHSDMFRSDQK